MSALTSLPAGYKAILIGASGGIGGGFSRAIDIDPNCGKLFELSRSSEPGLDITDESSIAAAATVLSKDAPYHLVIDATGILHEKTVQPEKSIRAVEPENLGKVFAVNATGPLLLMKHFFPLLARHERAIFATLSARVGSIGDNELGGWYAYRASKAALNMLVKTAAIELARKSPNAVCLALHPGTVKSQLSDPFSSSHKRFDPDEAARAMLSVINEAGCDKTGGFLAYDGTEIPW